jgi:long-chain acyl-CoA synthetase
MLDMFRGHFSTAALGPSSPATWVLDTCQVWRRKVVAMQIREHIGADKPAIILHPSGTVVTFDALEARANRLAHYFRKAGLTEGDAVAILMENNEHMHAIMWAARRSGLYYVPINTHLTAPEAAYIIDNSGAAAIIGSAATRKTLENLDDELRGVPGGLPALRMIADDDLDGWLRYPECVAEEPDTPIDDEREGDLLQYSSGTTGRPKGIKRELPHASPAEAPGMMSALVDYWLDRDAIYLSPAPIYHTAPSVWSMSVQAGGITTVVMEKFDPEGALDAIQRHRVTHGQFVPAMFTRMLKLPESVRNSYDVSSLKRVMHAAAPCPVEIKKQMINWWGPIVDEYYASSEAIGSTLITAEEWLAHPGSVGKASLGNIHILDEDGNEVPQGEPGEIYFAGGNTFEYLNDAAKTAASRDKHGWVTVGDVGYVDEDGYLFLTDRRHHMIISGGVNIYPQEAENMLVTHPKVLDAAVFGIPDDSMGQSVKGVVQTVDAADATDEFADDLLVWLRERLAHYKCPRSISFEAQLPRTETGKLYKQELVKKYSML